MKLVVQLFQRVYRRVFHGGKPSPTVEPKHIQRNSNVQKAQPKQASSQPQTRKQEDNRPYWQDKLKSDASDKKRAFYEKYRDRLQNQERDISPKL